MYFTKSLRRLKFNKTYIFYAIAYGLSSLVIPLGSQFLVNNLALAGIWANTVTFLTVIGVLICLAQVFRHTQIIISEYLQREIFVHELRKWKRLENNTYAHYYFEIYALLKSFAKIYVDIIDIILVAFFGLIAIIIFHPAFVVLPIVMAFVAYLIKRVFAAAYRTSIAESNEKYAIYDEIYGGREPSLKITYDYLSKRDTHFGYVRSISLKISILYSFSFIYVLAVGAYLIQIDQLSVGQLVAAELIISGIMTSFQKIPTSLESLYDFETSHYKIEKALRGLSEKH